MRDQLRARILNTAEALLFEQGFRAMRVDDLARELGISKRTLYEEFRSKDEIAQQVLLELDQRLHQAIEQTNTTRDSAERLRSVVELIARVCVRMDPQFFEDAETVANLGAWVEASRARCLASIEEVVRAGITDGTFRSSLNPRLVSRVLLAVMPTMQEWQARRSQAAAGRGLARPHRADHERHPRIA